MISSTKKILGKKKVFVFALLLCALTCFAFGINTRLTHKAYADTLVGFEVKSAALRVPDETYGEGIRFTIGLGDVTLNENATTGILIIPTVSLGESALTVDLSNTNLRKVEGVSWKDMGNGLKECYVHVYNIPPENYSTRLSICAYIYNDSDKSTTPIYTEVVSASVASVAEYLYENDETLSEEDKSSLQSAYLEYAVIYHNGDSTTNTTGIYHELIEEPDEPVKIGYTFGGWWNRAYTVEWNFASNTIGGTTTNLYAKWTANSNTAYTVNVYKTTDGGLTTTNISNTIDGFVSARTGTTDSSLDITSEAAIIVSDLGLGYSLNTSNSVLTGSIAPDGSTVLSIVVNYNPIEAMRYGDDINTVLFYDRALGVELQASSTLTYEYTTEKAYGDESGSLKVQTGEYNTTLKFDVKGKTYNSTDYVVFHVYAENKTKRMSIILGYRAGQTLRPNAWTQVLVPAPIFFGDVNGYDFFTFLQDVGSVENATLYISKAYILTAEQVTDLSTVSADTTYYIGETAFKGVPDAGSNGTNWQNNAVYRLDGLGNYSSSNKKSIMVTPMLIDGEFVLTKQGVDNPSFILYLSDGVVVSNGDEIYLTVDLYGSVDMSKLAGKFNGSDNFALESQSVTDIGDGYYRIIYKVTAKADGTLNRIRFDTNDTYSEQSICGQIRIKNIVISSENPS